MANRTILGIDEVGRGPWAGPLVVGAVVLGEDFLALPEYEELTDSKKLSEKKRSRLSQVILEKAAMTGLGWVKASEIDKYGLGPSLKLAARRAVKDLSIQVDEIVIDGTINLLAETPFEDRVILMKKADLLVKEVSAASIIAKVARDNYMVELALKYPGYGFEKHVGYGTALHRDALARLGVSPEHRMSFRPVADLAHGRGANAESAPAALTDEGSRASVSAVSTKAPMSMTPGALAEVAVAEYLEGLGHSVVVHNFKTRTCEIDLVSTQGQQIIFTEVKYSKNTKNGSPIERVTAEKQKQMEYAAKVFLARHPEYAGYQPLLAAASVTGVEFEVENWLIIH